LGSNTKGYGVKTHYIDSQNTDITPSSGRELYYLYFSLQEASPETFGYTLVRTKFSQYFLPLYMLECKLCLSFHIYSGSEVLDVRVDSSLYEYADNK